MIAAGFDSIDKSQEWITGKYAGIFEWDSAATKYQSALDDENSPASPSARRSSSATSNGGFSKVSMGMAITKTCEHPAEAATLINFLLNGEAALPSWVPSAASPLPRLVWLPLRLQALSRSWLPRQTQGHGFRFQQAGSPVRVQRPEGTTDGIYTKSSIV